MNNSNKERIKGKDFQGETIIDLSFLLYFGRKNNE